MSEVALPVIPTVAVPSHLSNYSHLRFHTHISIFFLTAVTVSCPLSPDDDHLHQSLLRETLQHRPVDPRRVALSESSSTSACRHHFCRIFGGIAPRSQHPLQLQAHVASTYHAPRLSSVGSCAGLVLRPFNLGLPRPSTARGVAC
jgi:hypothetical protein